MQEWTSVAWDGSGLVNECGCDKGRAQAGRYTCSGRGRLFAAYGADEVATLHALEAHRRVLDALIAEHGGRIANTAGDSVLAEFASLVVAVACAVKIQSALHRLNDGVPADRAFRFRFGVHLGDVLVRQGDLFGDGVNIAARLQGLAEPGGICTSGEAYAHVRKTLPLVFDDLGPQWVKNIEQPEPFRDEAFFQSYMSALSAAGIPE